MRTKNYIIIIIVALFFNGCFASKYNDMNKGEESLCLFFDVETKTILLSCTEPVFKGIKYNAITRLIVTERDTSQYKRDIKDIKIPYDSIKFPFSLKPYLPTAYTDRNLSLRMFTDNRFLDYYVSIDPKDWGTNKKMPFMLYRSDYPH